MSTYSDKLKDPRWQKKRLRVMERDGFKCRDCGDEKETLHVHHCFYEKGDPWNTKDDFLLTLCETCHKERQECEDLAKSELGKLFARIDSGSVHSIACDAHWLKDDELEDGVVLISKFKRDYENDIRWFNELNKTKTGRKIYLKVTKGGRRCANTNS